MSEINKEQEIVEKHDVLFSQPLSIFLSKPYNTTFIESRQDEVWATPKDPYSDVYSFIRPGNVVGLLKTSDAKISCDMSIRNQQNGLVANSNIIPPSLPLRTLFKTKELKINESLVTPSGNSAYLASWIAFLTRETPTMYKDSPEVNLCYPDTAQHMDAINGNNPQAVLRHGAVNNNTSHIIDTIDCPGFDEGGSEVYLPSAFKIELKLTRANKLTVMTGVAHADLTVADAKLMLNDLKITIPVFKPKDQLSTALNNMFIQHDKDAKYYTTVFRTVVSLVAGGRRKIRENDIFNGSVPVRLFILYSLQANYNGTINTNCFNFPWHNYQNIDVSVNSVSVGTIKNQKEAYSQLRDVLNRKYSEMPITFNQFINGYAVVAFDLTSNHDTHLAVLPARASGVVNCEIDFSQNTAAGTIIFIGEFRNEIKVGLKKPARLLYDI